ncbi:MAG TPA: HXXEE domain-containing protein [Polyangiaceae bacterium]|nr:HXXEE domain-containing protein [Polyangiaceae bacterium]
MPKSSTRRASQLTIIPVAFLVHNAEEALTIPAMLPQVQSKLASVLGPSPQLPSPVQYYATLLTLTLAAFAVWLAAHWRESLCYGLIVLQATLTLNIVNHVSAAVILRGYSPGLITSVTVEVAASVVVFSSLKRGSWLSRTQWVLLPVLALVLHGPVMFGGLWLLGRLS